MYITHDPDEYKTVKVDDGQVCGFHKLHPGEVHPNVALRHGACGCRRPRYNQVRRTLAEFVAIKLKRQKEEDDEILKKADAIRALRGHE